MRVLEKLSVSDANKVPAAFMLGYFELSDYRDLSQRHGEAFAQALINYFVAELQSSLATAELIARYSSNSFMVIIPSNDPVILQALVQKMASTFRDSVAIGGKLTSCK